MARISFPYPFEINRGVLWQGAWIPGDVEQGTTDIQVGPSGETEFLCGPGTANPIGFTLVELVRFAFTIKSWSITYNAESVVTQNSSSTTSSASGSYTATHTSGASDFEPGFLLSNGFLGSDIADGKGCAMGLAFHSPLSVGELFYPGINAIASTPVQFNTLQPFQLATSVGTFTISAGPVTKTCPIYSYQIYGEGQSGSLSSTISASAGGLWPYNE